MLDVVGAARFGAAARARRSRSRSADGVAVGRVAGSVGGEGCCCRSRRRRRRPSICVHVRRRRSITAYRVIIAVVGVKRLWSAALCGAGERDAVADGQHTSAGNRRRRRRLQSERVVSVGSGGDGRNNVVDLGGDLGAFDGERIHRSALAERRFPCDGDASARRVIVASGGRRRGESVRRWMRNSAGDAMLWAIGRLGQCERRTLHGECA